MTGLDAEFPGWRVWTSRPRGLLWATRIGDVHYHDRPRRPGWTLTAGPAPDTSTLRVLLAEQARLDRDPEPDPDTLYPADV